jgi:hypothetical protein
MLQQTQEYVICPSPKRYILIHNKKNSGNLTIQEQLATYITLFHKIVRINCQHEVMVSELCGWKAVLGRRDQEETYNEHRLLCCVAIFFSVTVGLIRAAIILVNFIFHLFATRSHASSVNDRYHESEHTSEPSSPSAK